MLSESMTPNFDIAQVQVIDFSVILIYKSGLENSSTYTNINAPFLQPQPSHS